MKKPATKAEKDYMSVVASLGCIICSQPAEIHHLRCLGSAGKRSSHMDCLPLCPNHHRIGGYGIAYHAGRKAFEANFGTELELLEKVQRQTGYNSDQQQDKV